MAFLARFSHRLAPPRVDFPQLCSNPLAGVFVEINASLILSGLLVEPFVIVRGVVTERD